jgi:hypothetical protein
MPVVRRVEVDKRRRLYDSNPTKWLDTGGSLVAPRSLNPRTTSFSYIKVIAHALEKQVKLRMNMQVDSA